MHRVEHAPKAMSSKSTTKLHVVIYFSSNVKAQARYVNS